MALTIRLMTSASALEMKEAVLRPGFVSMEPLEMEDAVRRAAEAVPTPLES